MNLTEILRYYDNCENLLQNGVCAHPTESTLLSHFDKTRREFAKSVGGSELHESWEKGVKLFNLLHAKIARTPCAPSAIITPTLERSGGSETLEELRGRAEQVDPSVKNSFEETNKALTEISSIDESFFSKKLAEMPSIDGITIFAVRDVRFWDQTRDCLNKNLQFRNWDLARPLALRSHSPFQRLVLFSPPWHLVYRSEEFLLRSPVAKEIHMFACTHEFSGSVQLSLLDNSKTISVRKPPQVERHLRYEDFEPISPPSIGMFSNRRNNDEEIPHLGDRINALPLRLGGNLGTYLQPDSSVWIVIPDTEKEPPICRNVMRIKANDLEPDHLILLTTQGGGDMIPTVADQILKGSRQIRQQQNEWKKALKTEILNRGFEAVINDLITIGSLNVSNVNLRNWSSPHSLGMDDLDLDLKAVLELTGLENKFNTIKNGICQLRTAHRVAGRKLQQKLVDNLSGARIDRVFKEGFQEFGDSEGAEKTIFLVEQLGLEEKIPAEWESTFFELEDTE